MTIDVVSAIVRAAGFVLLMQAAGIALFLCLFRTLTLSVVHVVHMGKWSALWAALLVTTFQLLQAGRMSGDFAGVMDASLQSMAFVGHAAWAWGWRTGGLLMIWWCLRKHRQPQPIILCIAAVAVAISFAISGHTATSSNAWLLRPLLVLHVLIAAFWFGALLPLLLILTRETTDTATVLVQRFSRIATGWVPLIAIAGIAMAALLVPEWAVLTTPYGLLLLAKLGLFAVLMVLAALNRWRYGPALAGTGAHDALIHLRRTVAIEYVLIIAVLGVTAVMTLFFSPES